MKASLEQLNMLSDYELNCAIAEKKGLPVRKRISKDGNSVYTDDLKGTGCFVDYCNVPNDYMPIAIEHEIDILRCRHHKKVWCEWMLKEEVFQTSQLNPDQTGRAVGIAFLLMELDK